MVPKRCKKCRKQIMVNPDDKLCVCVSCGAKMTISKTLSNGTTHDNSYGIRLWVMQ